MSEVATVSHVDSEDKVQHVGSRVRVYSEVAADRFDHTTGKWENGRDFDFGDVESLNDDGTVDVFWESAGCSCTADDPARAEKGSDLTLVTREEEHLYYLGHNKGYRDGEESAQEDFREVLGLDKVIADAVKAALTEKEDN